MDVNALARLAADNLDDDEFDVVVVDEEKPQEPLDEGPTFEDLAIDDTLSDLDRVARYICSNIALQRVIHVKMLPETATSVGVDETTEHLIPLLEPLVNDVEYVVRQHVALQFPPLAAFLVQRGGDGGYRVLLDKLIPLLTQLVSDKQHEVRTAAGESLVEVAALVRPEDQGQHILTIVLPLAHDDDNEQFRIAAVTLYQGLAEHFGPELCQQFCVPELISLSEDPVFRVRKSTAQSFAGVSKIAGQEISRERLLPSFQRLAHDDIWAVRKACAECLVGFSEALAPGDRGELLIPLFEGFFEDASRWVRMAAYQNLGPFLATLARKDISDELLEHFLGMATSAASAQLGGSGEVDMKFHCAFNFPAVVSLLGPDEWPRLAPTFEALSQETFWKIRRTFAYSLHELARILGPERTEAQLATAFDNYLRDVPDVKLGAMLHFADFLEHVSPSFRESYLPVLSELLQGLAEPTKWRTREILSHQLPQLCRIFPDEPTFAVIYPLALQLVTDSVAVVRHRSVRAFPLLIDRIGARPEWRAALVARLGAFATAPCFTDRQVFLLASGAFLDAANAPAPATATPEGDAHAHASPCPRAFFETHLAGAFFDLARDPVSNVRAVFARVWGAHGPALGTLDACPTALREAAAADVGTTDAILRLLEERLPARPRPSPATDADADAGATAAAASTAEATAEAPAAVEPPTASASDAAALSKGPRDSSDEQVDAATASVSAQDGDQDDDAASAIAETSA